MMNRLEGIHAYFTSHRRFVGHLVRISTFLQYLARVAEQCFGGGTGHGRRVCAGWRGKGFCRAPHDGGYSMFEQLAQRRLTFFAGPDSFDEYNLGILSAGGGIT
jgi:hypothetical protein